MSMVSNPLDKSVGMGISVKGVLILGGATLLTNFGSQYIQNKNETLAKHKIMNDSALSGVVKIVSSVVGAATIKNKYVKYGLVGVGLDGAQDLLIAGVRKARDLKGSSNGANASSESVA